MNKDPHYGYNRMGTRDGLPAAQAVSAGSPLRASIAGPGLHVAWVGRLVIVTLLAMCALSCSKDNPTAAGAVTQLRFHNAMELTTLAGSSQKYQVRNLTALGMTWNEELGFNVFSSFQEIEARSTDFTVQGEMRAELGDSWVPTKWTKRVTMSAGSSSTVELTFEE